MKTVIASKVFRIGWQRLLYDPKTDEYFVSIINRTYASTVKIPRERVALWKKALQ